MEVVGAIFNILGLITARGGSKGLPGKNIAPLAGKPLIAWTIETALKSRGLDMVVVSTDDGEIAGISRQWGAEVPFMRPAELAQDNSPHIPVMQHAVSWVESNREIKPEYILLLQPTSPLRSAEDIDNAIEIALEKDADGIVSVCEAPHHPFFAKRITDDGRLEYCIPQPGSYLPRQAMSPAYVSNGSIFLVRYGVLMEKNTMFPDRTYPYLMPRERSLDIDTPWDMRLADLILKDRMNHGDKV